MSSSKKAQGPARQRTQQSSSSSTSKASNNRFSSQFAYPIILGNKLAPFLSGLAEHEGGPGSFVDGSANDRLRDLRGLYRRQPSLFPARENWQGWDPKNPIRLSINNLDFEVFEEKLKNISYPGPQTPLGRRKWIGRVAGLWGCARKMIRQEMLKDGDLCTLMQLISQGLEDIIIAHRVPITINSNIIQPNKDWAAEERSPFLADDYEKVDCRICLEYYTSPEDLRKSWEGKRFVVVLVSHAASVHYTTLVWDTVAGKLYHFDTMLGGRKSRMKRSVLAWRELLGSIGLPYNFWYYSMPLCQQPDTWECGPLAVYCALQFVRGLVGLTASEVSDLFDGQVEGLQIDGKADGDNAVPPFDVPLRDWVPRLEDSTQDFRSKVIIARNSLIVWWTAVIFDHIGIQDLMYGQPSSSGKLIARKIPGDDLIEYFPLVDSSPRPVSDIYTNLGGEAVIYTTDCRKVGMPSHHRLLIAPDQPPNQPPILTTPRPPAVEFPHFRWLFPAVPPVVKAAWLQRGVRFADSEVPLRYEPGAKTRADISLLSSPEIDPQAILDSTMVDLTSSPEQPDPEGKGKGKGKARADSVKDRAATPKRESTPPVQGFDQLLLNTPRGPRASGPSGSDVTPRASQQRQPTGSGSMSSAAYSMSSSFVKGFVGVNQLPGYGVNAPGQAAAGVQSTPPQHMGDLPRQARSPKLLGPIPSTEPQKTSTPSSSRAANSPKPTGSGPPSGSRDVVMKERSDSDRSPLVRPTPLPRKSRGFESPLGSDTSMPDAPGSAGPSDRTQRRLFHSRPQGLPASTSNMSLTGPDAEYQPSTTGSSPSGGGELSDQVSRSPSVQLDSPQRRRGPVEDVPNPIVGARVKTPAEAGYEGLEERAAAAPAGSRAMSVVLGLNFDLPNYPDRATSELVFHRGTDAETRNYATHVPSGFHRLGDLGGAQGHILRSFNGEDQPAETRAQRRERWAREKEARSQG